MYLEKLSLTDFRSYAQVDLSLEPGVTVLVGSNGIGKTNLMEAIGYLATLNSHRVSTDAPLLRFGAERAMIRAKLVRGEQSTVLELEINAARANRGRINRSNPVRARDLLGICQTVLFAPEDLALVKGDPSSRRRFLDELLVSLMPRHAATRSDYDRVLKQRNALLKSARAGKFSSGHEATLDVWDQHMARAGAELLHARLELVDRLQPHLKNAYAQLTDGSKEAAAVYRSTLQDSLDDDGAGASSGPDLRAAPPPRKPKRMRPAPMPPPSWRRTCACSPSSSSPTATSRPLPQPAARNWNGASRWSDRTAMSLSSCLDRLRPRATPHTGKPGPCACPCAWPPTTSCSTMPAPAGRPRS